VTASIQLAALAWARRIAVGEPSSVVAITSRCDGLAQHRDVDGDGLIWIIAARCEQPCSRQDHLANSIDNRARLAHP
jgi:hypothetical protein